MNLPTVKFNVKDQPEFFKELRKRVNQHFKDNNLKKQANINMKLKTAFMITLYISPLVLMLTGIFESYLVLFGMCVLMGLGMAGIGLSIMHDANHGAYSKNKNVNKSLGFLLNILGGYHVNWKIQHNVLHHSYTNIDGHDEDLEIGIMRFSPLQKRKKMHKYQLFYAPILYGMMTMYWSTVKDFLAAWRYNKKNLLEAQKTNFAKSLTNIVVHKIWYFTIFLALPFIFIPAPWWIIFLGFITMHFVCGLFLSLIFQPAHVIEETNFYSPPKSESSMENNWAIHQLNTTANFSRKSIFFSWFIGGLNYQIEHHLFPNICHIHYKRISKIVKETTIEYGLPYHEHKNFVVALKSHFTLLHQLGTGKYDLRTN